jgi:hypothetical protein
VLALTSPGDRREGRLPATGRVLRTPAGPYADGDRRRILDRAPKGRDEGDAFQDLDSPPRRVRPKAIYARRTCAYERRPARPFSGHHQRRPWAGAIELARAWGDERWAARWSGSRSSSASDGRSQGQRWTSPGAGIAGAVRRVPREQWVSDHVTGALPRDDRTDQVAGPHGPARDAANDVPTRHNGSDARVRRHRTERVSRHRPPTRPPRGYTTRLRTTSRLRARPAPGPPPKRRPDSGAITPRPA